MVELQIVESESCTSQTDEGGLRGGGGAWRRRVSVYHGEECEANPFGESQSRRLEACRIKLYVRQMGMRVSSQYGQWLVSKYCPLPILGQLPHELLFHTKEFIQHDGGEPRGRFPAKAEATAALASPVLLNGWDSPLRSTCSMSRAAYGTLVRCAQDNIPDHAGAHTQFFC